MSIKPTPKVDTEAAPVSVWLAPEDRKALRETAKRERRTMSNLAAKYILDGLDRERLRVQEQEE